MIGVLLLFKWGPPQPSHDAGVGIGLEDGTYLPDLGKTVAERDAEIERRRRFYGRMSRLGLWFIFFGFALQLVAVWVPARE